LQTRGPTIATLKKLRIAPPGLALNHRDPLGIKLARAAGEFEWRQRRFHRVWKIEDEPIMFQIGEASGGANGSVQSENRGWKIISSSRE
jgi:hypothetical protein